MVSLYFFGIVFYSLPNFIEVAFDFYFRYHFSTFQQDLAKLDGTARSYENDFIDNRKDEQLDGTLSPNTDGHAEKLECPNKGFKAYIDVIALCSMIAFGGFICDWDTGTISGIVRRFGESRKNGTHYLSKGLSRFDVRTFKIGWALGGLTLTKPAEIRGRKPALTKVIVVYIVGIIIQIASVVKWYQYAIVRIFIGFGVGGIAVLNLLLILEVAPKHIRGAMVDFYEL